MSKLHDDIAAILERLSAGTQVGPDGRFLPPLSIPKDTASLLQISSASSLLLSMLGCFLPSDAQAIVVWKVAAYATRRDCKDEAFRAHIAQSIHYLLGRPALLTSRCGLGTIIKIAKEADLAERRRQEKNAKAIDGTPVPWVPPLPIWQTECEVFRLCELKHPRHISDVGKAMSNCMHSLYVPGFPTLGIDYHTDAALPYLAYWRVVVTGASRVFAIYQGGQPRAALQVKRNSLIAYDLPNTNMLPIAIQRAAIAELAATLEGNVLRVRTRLPDTLPPALIGTPHVKIELGRHLSEASS